ncbi:MAG: hypothetical protein J6C96_00060 [Oscillospiraceae bacterium]|nr:hypothetical protein [Oscillospiraceae bacterium]
MGKIELGFRRVHSQSLYEAAEREKGKEWVKALKERESKYCDCTFELEVPDITGKSEKQIQYAERLRFNELNKRVEMFFKRIDGKIDVLKENDPFAAKIDECLEHYCLTRVSDMAKAVVLEEGATLLKMTDAAKIIDYCTDYGGICMEIIENRSKKEN